MSIVKFLLNTAIAGAVAGGVYYYLDQNAKRNAANAEDPDETPKALDSENIKDAADRAYTTIVHGTEEVTESIKRSVGPQGEQIMNSVQDAAGKVQETVTHAGKKVGDIITDSDSTVQEKASAVADTFRYAAVDLHDKIRETLSAAQPEEFEEDDDTDVQIDAYAETTDGEDVTVAETEDDDPDIEVEFYVDDKDAEAAETEMIAEADAEGMPTVEVFVETDDDTACVADENAASGETPTTSADTAETSTAGATPVMTATVPGDAQTDAETVAEPVTDAAKIEEFFDDEESN